MICDLKNKGNGKTLPLMTLIQLMSTDQALQITNITNY